jgi:hypothetical protein
VNQAAINTVAINHFLITFFHYPGKHSFSPKHLFIKYINYFSDSLCARSHSKPCPLDFCNLSIITPTPDTIKMWERYDPGLRPGSFLKRDW